MRRFQKQCHSVIDPMKFKRGFLVTINCQEALQDGYENGICEKVSFKDQSIMKANSAKLKTEQ